MRVAILGAGWGGLSAAVCAIRAGHAVTVYEASRDVGGRARALPQTLPDGTHTTLDNGQHIMIGAYRETLSMMRLVGVEPELALLRLPLTWLFPDGGGLRFPAWPAPLDALAGVLRARGWSTIDKISLLRLAAHWRVAGFRCAPQLTVNKLCAALTPRVLRELVQPLCLSALNTPPERASAQVFLRVLRDSMLGASGNSHLLLPRVDLGALFPAAAVRWLTQRGGHVRLGARAENLVSHGAGWLVDDTPYDLVVIATTASDAVRLVDGALPVSGAAMAQQLSQWSDTARALRHEAIATIYAWGQGVALAHPMLALRSDPSNGAPAQFVFDRGRLGGPGGLLAFVVSACTGDREFLQQEVLQQAGTQLGLKLQALQTVVEKRATFACTAGLERPGMHIAPGLRACGDYVDGPYPSTLEGAVRSGVAAIQS